MDDIGPEGDPGGEATPFETYMKDLEQIRPEVLQDLCCRLRRAGIPDAIGKAEDIFGEVVLGLCRRPETISGVEDHHHFANLIRQKARWRLSDFLRRKRIPTVGDALSEYLEARDSGLLHGILARDSSPEVQEAIACLRDCLMHVAKAKPVHASVFKRRYQKWPHRDVAAIVGITEQTSRRYHGEFVKEVKRCFERCIDPADSNSTLDG